MRKYPLIKAGDRFGAWLVLNDQHKGDIKILCRCTKCGLEKMVFIRSLHNGDSTQCQKCRGKEQRKIHEGDKIFHWKIIKRVGKYFICECDCSKKTRRKIPSSSLLSGRTKSCGCRRSDNQTAKQEKGKKQGMKIMNAIHEARLSPSYKRKTNKNSSTGVTGVCMYGSTGKYRAYISVDHRTIELGHYDTIEDAAAARRDGEDKYFTDRIQRVEEIKMKFKGDEKDGNQ
jgi:hypothetical protein